MMSELPRPFLMLLTVALTASLTGAAGLPSFLPDAPIHADGLPVVVPGYSVPTVADWNNDGLADLIVGEGGGGIEHAKVRVYLNTGTSSAPSFGAWFYAQADGADLDALGEGCNPCACLGAFPRVVNWNDDGRKDLLVGLQDGRARIFLNTATDQAPAFDSGTDVQIYDNAAGHLVDLSVGARTTPSFVDWDRDGLDDILSGAYDGKVRIFRNVGSPGAPAFDDSQVLFASDGGGDLFNMNFRTSPDLFDLDGDGRRDLILGDTTGQLRFYPNTATDDAPAFDGYVLLEAGGSVIDLPGSARSRPFVFDFNQDGIPDILVGAGDGQVHY